MTTEIAQFIRGYTSIDTAMPIDLPHIAFIGRSNVGKSSTINALTKQKKLAKTSAFPGRTQQVNVFATKKYYIVDLPGYGYARMSKQDREKLQKLINEYLFIAPIPQQYIFLIIDAYVGFTESDNTLLEALIAHKKQFIIIANKIDKVKKSHRAHHIANLQQKIGDYKLLAYSAEDPSSIQTLRAVIDSLS